jgi:8-oxo-dGTP pyrophosphatase MutT (NUDIX family)
MMPWGRIPDFREEVAVDGMTRAEVDKAESKDFALGKGPLRPRDAATLILLDTSGSGVKVLMGRRHRSHAFMPGKFVFPGGRTDPADSRIAAVGELHPDEAAKLSASRRPVSPARARAIAMSAIRETFEETGLLLARPAPARSAAGVWREVLAQGALPDLAPLAYVARAITPPGRSRRFDARFFMAEATALLSLERTAGCGELDEIEWIPLSRTGGFELPAITKFVLSEVRAHMDDRSRPIPFVRFVRGQHTIEYLE